MILILLFLIDFLYHPTDKYAITNHLLIPNFLYEYQQFKKIKSFILLHLSKT
jgi:hypothetical protein